MWMVSVAVALAVEPEPLRVEVNDEAGTPIPGAEVAVVVPDRTGAITWRPAPAEFAVRDLRVRVVARAPGFGQGASGGLHRAGDQVDVTLMPGVTVRGVVRGPVTGDGWVVAMSGPAQVLSAEIRMPLDGGRFWTDQAFPGTWRLWLWRRGQDHGSEWVEQTVEIGEDGTELTLHARALRR
ncbi:MAG: carboxypeptidase-like regulatory domain-containing protein [Myxococcales bacterium]|nr:carboxypeptidase-like regulatory domain-containing protein [Myxococcales bacterium]